MGRKYSNPPVVEAFRELENLNVIDDPGGCFGIEPNRLLGMKL